MKDKISLGIAGCGAYAQVVHFPIFRNNPQCNLAALCDSDVRKIDHLGEKYGIKNRYQDFQEMVENKELDAIVVATPNYLHAPMAITALEFGKDVLVELPMATSHRDGLEMAAAAKKNKRKLVVAMNNRLRPDVQTFKKFIENGELGDVYYVKTGWLIGTGEWILHPWRRDQMKSGGGAILSLGTTLLDIATYFLEDREISTVFASIHKKDADAGVEDTAMCLVNFKDGTLLTIEVSWSLIFEKDFLYCNAFGRKGAALLNPLKIQKELHDELVNVTPTFPQKNIYRVSYELQAQFFLDALIKNAAVPFGYENSLKIAKITDAFYESAGTQKLVKL